MVEPKVEDDADASEKKAPRKRWNKKKNKSGDRYTPEDGGKEKFDGVCDDTKKKVFSFSRNQADNFAHTHKMLQIVAGMKYSAKVAAAIRDFKKKPVMMKVPVKPELSALILASTVVDTATTVPVCILTGRRTV